MLTEQDDSGLDEALMKQERPPKAPTLEEARTQMEKLLLPGLVATGLSEPEARVEAMNLVARFERLAIGRMLQQKVEGKP